MNVYLTISEAKLQGGLIYFVDSNKERCLVERYVLVIQNHPGVSESDSIIQCSFFGESDTVIHSVVHTVRVNKYHRLTMRHIWDRCVLQLFKPQTQLRIGDIHFGRPTWVVLHYINCVVGTEYVCKASKSVLILSCGVIESLGFVTHQGPS